MKIAKFSHKGWHTAYSRLFRKMNKAEVPNLVIDLRNNGGGSLVNAYKLLSYLIDTTEVQTLSTPLRNYPYKKYTKGNVAFKFTRLAYRFLGDYKTVNDTDYFSYKIKPREKNHYKGRIFICINGGSFSASCLVAAYLEKNPRVTLVGEETGGAREGCNAGVTPYYRLPYTGLRVRVPAFRVTNDISPEITGRGIIPDYQTSYSFKDIVGRRDVDLEKVIELINMPR